MPDLSPEVLQLLAGGAAALLAFAGLVIGLRRARRAAPPPKPKLPPPAPPAREVTPPEDVVPVPVTVEVSKPAPKPAPVPARPNWSAGLSRSRAGFVGKLEGLLRGRASLDEKTLARAKPARWAVLGKLERKKDMIFAELRLMDVASGDVMRSYFHTSAHPKETGALGARAALPDTPVLAVADGIVSHTGLDGGYGRMIEVTHGDGYVTRYAHNAKVLVKPGQTVKRGDAIALMGSTGRSTGPHVHFEVLRNGKPMNPLSFVQR